MAITGSVIGLTVMRQANAVRRSSLDFEDFAAVVETASTADIVRQLQLAAIRAFLKGNGGQRMMAATHVAAGRRGFALGNGHEAPV